MIRCSYCHLPFTDDAFPAHQCAAGDAIRREELRDAVVEAAVKLTDAHSLLWSAPDDMLVSEVLRRIKDQIFDVINAVAALRTHERKAGDE